MRALRLPSLVLVGVLGAIPAGAVPVEVRIHAVFPSGEPMTGLLGVFDTASPGPFDLNGTVMGIDFTANHFSGPLVVHYQTSGVVDATSEIGFAFTNTTPGSLAGDLVDLNLADGEDDTLRFSLGGSFILVAAQLLPFDPQPPGDVFIFFNTTGQCHTCSAILSFSFTVVPEPSTALLMSLGLAVVAWRRRA